MGSITGAVAPAPGPSGRQPPPRTPAMETLLRAEDAGLLLSFGLFFTVDVAWWWFPALLLAPDIGMIGYAGGPRWGAATYNIPHHRGVAAATYLAGLAAGSAWVQAASLVLLGHSGLDRGLGYGLKTVRGFHHTHLVPVGP